MPASKMPVPFTASPKIRAFGVINTISTKAKNSLNWTLLYSLLEQNQDQPKCKLNMATHMLMMLRNFVVLFYFMDFYFMDFYFMDTYPTLSSTCQNHRKSLMQYVPSKEPQNQKYLNQINCPKESARCEIY